MISEVLNFVINDELYIKILKFVVELGFEEVNVLEVVGLLELLMDDQGIKLLITNNVVLCLD